MASSATQENQPPAETPEYPAEVQGYVDSVSHILEDVSAVRAIESTVHHDSLEYLGIVDCVARYRYIWSICRHKYGVLFPKQSGPFTPSLLYLQRCSMSY